MLKPNIIHNMDCMEFMVDIPDKYFELAIVDPPYGIGASKPSKKPNACKQKNGSTLHIKSNPYKHKDWDNETPNDTYFEELFRISKEQIIFGCNYFSQIPTGGRIVWDKVNGDSDQYGCEIAYCSLNNRTDIVHYMWAGMFQGKSIKEGFIQQGNKLLNEHRIHPCQKPVPLYEWLLQNYAKEGDKILDTHVGSASSFIACYNMKFDIWGCELDKDYCQDATKRLEEHKAQIRWEF